MDVEYPKEKVCNDPKFRNLLWNMENYLKEIVQAISRIERQLENINSK
jgi:hypothetical protein